MAPPIAAATVVACVPGSVSPQVEVIGSGSSSVFPGLGGAAGAGGGPVGQQLPSKNCHFNADTIKLIECVKARPALWHRKHLRQRVQVAHRGWDEIRKAFKANDVASLKVRWKTLRDSFRREVKRMEDGEITTSAWPLFERMSFLIGHFRTRESFLKSGATSPSQSKSESEHWKYGSDSKQDSQTETDEPMMTHNAATSSMGESEPEVVESYTVVYADAKPAAFEVIPQPQASTVVVEASGVAAVVESDPEDLTVIETYETVQTEELDDDNGKMEAQSSQDVIEVSEHMYGEVTFKNKLRARIKTEPVDGDLQQRRGQERSCGGGQVVEVDADYNFLMSLHPFMRRLPNRKNLSVRIKIQQLIAEAMDEC